MDEKSNMKLEELLEDDERTRNNYNPVWRLQVTDDKSKVLFDGNYVDRNEKDDLNHRV